MNRVRSRYFEGQKTLNLIKVLNKVQVTKVMKDSTQK